MKARIEIFCQVDLHDLETGNDDEIRAWLDDNRFGNFFYDLIEVVEDDQELSKE